MKISSGELKKIILKKKMEYKWTSLKEGEEIKKTPKKKRQKKEELDYKIFLQ